MSEFVRQIIEETLKRFGRDASYDQYRDIAFEMFPNEMAAHARSFERQGFIKWIKTSLRQAANVDESDGEAPEVQLDLLPGWPAPAYLNIGSDVDPRLVRVQDSVIADWETCIAKRHKVAARITARAEDLEQKLEWFRSHACGNDTLAQAIERASQVSVAQP